MASLYWSTGIVEERLYYGFDTRGLDAFLIGAVVALALQLYGAPRLAVRYERRPSLPGPAWSPSSGWR